MGLRGNKLVGDLDSKLWGKTIFSGIHAKQIGYF